MSSSLDCAIKRLQDSSRICVAVHHRHKSLFPAKNLTMQNWRKNLHIDLRTHLSLEETKYMRKVDHGSLDIQFAFSRGGTSETLSQYPGRMTVGDGRWHGLTTGCWILCYGPWNGLWRAEGPPFQNFFIYQDRSLKFSTHIWSKMICIYVSELLNCPWNGPCGGPKGESSPQFTFFLFIKIEG